MRNFSFSTPCRVVRGCVPVAAMVLSAIAAQGQTRTLGTAPGAVDLGPLPGGEQVSASVYLRPDAAHVAALDAFLHDLEQPGSASYHRFVTPAEFAARFGPTDAQEDAVRDALTAAGLHVDAVSGLRLRVSGPAGLMERALAPGLHREQVGAAGFRAATAEASLPAAIHADVLAVGGMTTLPEAHPLSLVADGRPVAAGGLGAVEELAGVVEAGGARILGIHGAACAGEYSSSEQEAVRALLREAEAEGLTVLAEGACATAGEASFPAGLSGLVSVLPAASGGQAVLAGEVRPTWQAAAGLPVDNLRYAPDAVVPGGLDALATTLQHILATMPPAADGTLPRLGALGPVLYQLAAEPGLFTEPDGAPAGTWETGTGLGTLDLKSLDHFYPRGALSTYIQVNTDPLYATHGAPITFTTQIKDTSGNGKAAPTGTATFRTDTGNYLLGTATLTPSGALSSTAQVTYSKLPTASYNVIVTYSGDANYAGNSNQTFFTIGPEEGTLSATFPASVALGATIPVVITDTAPSGVGAPNVTGYIIPQGITNPKTYSVLLTPNANGSSSSGTVSVPATQAGTMTLFLGCTSTDPNFTCYNSKEVQVTVGKSTPTASLKIVPNPIVDSLPVLFTMQLTGQSGQAIPTGTVIFFDNGVNIGTNALDANSKATLTLSGVSATAKHAFTATYYGDNNYIGADAQANSTGSNTSTTALTVSPTVPVNGTTTTLSATVAPGSGSTVTTTPTGSVMFYQDGALLGAGTLDATGKASITSTTLSSTAAHNYTASYGGDSNYGTSTSNTVQVQATASGSTLAAVKLTTSTATVTKGTTATLTATVSSGSSTSQVTPTGTVTFTSSTQGLLGTATLAAGVASLNPTFTTSGAATITATYSGDTTYATASGTAALSVSGTATGTTASATTVTSSAPTVTQSGSATLTATVASGTAASTAVPTGSVTFTSSTQGVLGTVPLNAAGVASVAPTFTIAGAATITATYSGDATYAASAGGTAITVSGTVATGALSLVVNPTITTYGTTVNLTATVNAAPTSGTAGPSGTVTFSLQPNVGGTALTYSAVLSPTSGTTAIATLSISTLAAGTYTVTATCTGTNFSCTGLQATAGIQIQKAPTSLGLTASPSQIVVGQPTQLTGTITLSSGGNAPCLGVVSFYVSNSLVATVPVSGNVANYTLTLPSSVTNSLYAAYSGDTNCLNSTSSTITVVAPTVSTSITVAASNNTILVNGAETLTATVQSTPSAAVPNPGIPGGTVTFYDTLNGLQTPLGSAAILQTGPISGTATFSTTGLKAGSHAITAQYTGATGFAASQSGSTVVVVQDYSLQFAPPSATVVKGGTVTAFLSILPVNGFSGQVVLGCVPPAGAASTCAFAPNTVSGGSGTVTMTVTTTVATTRLTPHGFPGRDWAEGVSLAGILLAVLAPVRRRRWRAQLLLLVGLTGAVVLGMSGCTSVGTLGSAGGSTGAGTSGTPSGTLQYTITASGTDGRTSTTKTAYYSVTVQ